MKLFCVLPLIAGLALVGTLGFAETRITMLNSKGEITPQLEDAAKAFSAENPGITVEILSAQPGQSPFQAMTSYYASGNAPALAMLDPADVAQFSDKFLDLSKEEWVKDSTDNFKIVTTKTGAVLGFPFTVEGYGMIYNKSVMAKAGVDPTKIHTTKDLEAAFKKVQATGAGALVVAPMDWSLGAHFLGIAYGVAGKDDAGLLKFIADLRAGKADIAKAPGFTGLLDTFDVMKKYNLRKRDALAVTYDDCPPLIAQGKVGFYFQGNWAWPQMANFTKDTSGFGFIPVPVSNNASDAANNGIPTGVTKYIGVDKTQNNADQQAAAKKFLNWLVYSKAGQDFLVNKANLIPAFKNISLPLKDPLGQSIQQYILSGHSLYWVNMPAPDHWSKVGASMQKYLVGATNRSGLYKEIQNYWKSVKY